MPITFWISYPFLSLYDRGLRMLNAKKRIEFLHCFFYNDSDPSLLGIAPTQSCTHFLKIGFIVAGGRVLFLLYSHFLKYGCNSKSTPSECIFLYKPIFNYRKTYFLIKLTIIFMSEWCNYSTLF